MGIYPALVGFTGHGLFGPVLVIQIPFKGFFKTGFKGFFGHPVKFPFYFMAVNGVSPVVSGAVFNKADLIFVGLSLGQGMFFIKKLTESVNDFKVGFFVKSPYVVDFTGFSCFKDTAQSLAVVNHIEPVPDLLSIPVNGKIFSIQCVLNYQGNEFFRKLVGAVIVGTVGDNGWKSIGVIIGADQVIRRGFTGTVGTVGFVVIFLCKGRVIRLQGTINLIG